MKNKMIILGIIISFLIILLPYSENVNASTTVKQEGFQGTTTGIDIVAGMCNVISSSKRMSGTFYPNLIGRSGTPLKGFQCGNGATNPTGFINLTLQESEYLIGFSWHSYESFVYSGGNMYLYFFNRTYDTYSSPIILMRYYATSKNQLQYDAGVGMNSIGDYDHYHSWTNCGWNITDSSGTVEYFSHGVEEIATAYNSGKILAGYKIDSLYFTGNSNLNILYLDDLNFSLSESYEGVSSQGCIDLSEYTMFGNTYSTYTNDGQYKGISDEFGHEVTGTIKAIQLPILQSFYEDYDDNLNNYSLYFWHTNIGHPTCYFVYNGIGYLEWDTDITLDNELIRVTFYHDYNKIGSAYWQYYSGAYGSGNFYEGNENPVTYTYFDGSIYAQHHKLIWAMYLEQDIINPPPENVYLDTFGCSGFLYKNSTGYVYDINSPIILDYTLSSTENPYQIHGYYNGSYIWDIIFPYDCVYPSGNIIYYVGNTVIGKYNFTLMYDSDKPKGNLTCYIIGSVGKYRIYSMPSKTSQFEKYTVYYKYEHGSTNGVIACFDSSIKSNDLDNAIFRMDINDGDSGSFIYSGNTGIYDYWRMFVNNSYNTPVGDLHIHYIESQSENSLSVSPETLQINDKNTDDLFVIVTWTHLFAGSDIKIMIGNTVYSATDGSGRIDYTPRTTGKYTCRMYKDQNGTIQDLCFSYFDVDNIEGTTPEFTFEIEPPYSYFAGIFIIIISTLSPLLIIGMVKHDFNLSSIPQFLYLVMAVIGFVITIILGFFPLWSVAVLTLISILIIAIIWLKGGQSV